MPHHSPQATSDAPLARIARAFDDAKRKRQQPAHATDSISAARNYSSSSLAPNTVATYKAAINNFTRMLVENGTHLSDYPTTVAGMMSGDMLNASRKWEQLLMGFAHYIVIHDGNRITTARSYVKIVKKYLSKHVKHQIDLGYEWCELSNLFRRFEQKIPQPRVIQAGWTVEDIRAIHAQLNTGTANAALYRAATLVLFFGVHRSSDYITPRDETFDPSRDATRSDISVDQQAGSMIIHIKQTKPGAKHVTAHGDKHYFSQPGNALCPVRAMLEYLSKDPLRAHESACTTPLFRRDNGRALNYNDMLKFCKQAAVALHKPNINAYATRSFRIGGATLALSCPSGNEVRLRALGYWDTSAMYGYLRPTPTSMKKLQTEMVHSGLSTQN